MSKTAWIRLCPAVSHAIVSSDAERRTLYEDVKILDYLGVPPVCIDHDENRSIGQVADIFQIEDTALYPAVTPWLVARVRLDDDAPAWIQKGTGASISTKGGFDSDLFGWPVKRHAILYEISVCSVTHKPVEPLARVIFLKDEVSKAVDTFRPPPVPAPTRVSGPVRGHAELQHRRQNWRRELERRYTAAEKAAAGGYVDYEAIIRGLQSELGLARISAIDEAYEAFKQKNRHAYPKAA